MAHTTKRTSQRQIAVIAPMGTLDHQPGILNAIACFAEAGYAVEVFALRNNHYPGLACESKRVSVRYLPISFRSRNESHLWATALFALWLPFALRGPYVAVFAGGIRALLATWFVSWFRKLRIINLQLELYIGAKLDGRFARIFKWLERRAVRKCFLSLIHDETRASMFCEDMGISRNRVGILPNSPRGEGEIRRSRFLADRYGIDYKKRLLLSAGSLTPAFLAEEIVGAAQNLPPEWTCVVHSAQPRTDNDPYICHLHAANHQNRVILSLAPVPYEKVGEVLSSADIGLAVYGAVGGLNTTEVGLASGKLCHFLQNGVPVIVSDYPALREFVTRHRVGVPVADLDDILPAIATIMDDYDGYCHRAAETFTRELAFQTHFQRVLDRLNSV